MPRRLTLEEMEGRRQLDPAMLDESLQQERLNYPEPVPEDFEAYRVDAPPPRLPAAPLEPPRPDIFEGDIEDPELAATLEGIGNVPGKAAEKLSSKLGLDPKRMPVEQQDAVFKFASEQAKPAAAPPSKQEQLDAAMKLAQEQAGRGRGIEAIGNSFQRVSDLVLRQNTPRHDYDTERPVREAERLGAAEAAKAKSEEARRQWEAEIGLRRDELTAKSAPKPVNPLEEQKTRAEIAKLEAETRRADRKGRGAAGPKPGSKVPGLEVQPGAAPTAEDAKKVKASLASLNTMQRYIADLRKLHATHGTEYGGAVGTQMAQLVRAIQLEGKNIAQLGALSGPDMQLMEDIAGMDPSSLGNNVKAMFGVDNTATALHQLEKWLTDQSDATMQTYGYQRPKAATGRPASAPGGSGVDDVLAAFGK